MSDNDDDGQTTGPAAGRHRSLVEYDWSAGADQVAANVDQVARQIAGAAEALRRDAANRAERE